MKPIALNEVCPICLGRFTLIIDREDKDLLVIPRFYRPWIPEQLDYIVLWYRDDRLRLRRLTLKNVHISLRTDPNMRRLLQSISPGGRKVYRMD